MALKKRPGYILITSLLLLTGLSMLVVSLLRSVWTAQSFSAYARDQIQSYTIAQAGIEIAQAQMTQEREQEKNNQQKQEQNGVDEETAYLAQVMTYVNRWQRFALTQERDGVEGTIYLHITPEEGKIPINTFFDRNNKAVTETGQKIASDLKNTFQQLGMQKDIASVLKEMAEDAAVFDEPTQLLAAHDAFAVFDDRRFLETQPETEQPTTWYLPALLDLVTTYTQAEDMSLHPLFFSPSTCKILGLNQLPQGEEQRKEFVAMLKEKLTQEPQWQRDWDQVLAPYYGVSFSELSQALSQTFATDRGATWFSVVSYGYVGDVYTYLYVIMERVPGELYDSFRIHRMYSK